MGWDDPHDAYQDGLHDGRLEAEEIEQEMLILQRMVMEYNEILNDWIAFGEFIKTNEEMNPDDFDYLKQETRMTMGKAIW